MALSHLMSLSQRYFFSLYISQFSLKFGKRICFWIVRLIAPIIFKIRAIFRVQMKAFFRKVRLHFSNQPSTHARILKEISTVLSGPTVKLEDLKNLGGKLFKSSQLLLDEFLSIFPSVMIGSFPSLNFCHETSHCRHSQRHYWHYRILLSIMHIQV